MTIDLENKSDKDKDVFYKSLVELRLYIDGQLLCLLEGKREEFQEIRKKVDSFLRKMSNKDFYVAVVTHDGKLFQITNGGYVSLIGFENPCFNMDLLKKSKLLLNKEIYSLIALNLEINKLNKEISDLQDWFLEQSNCITESVVVDYHDVVYVIHPHFTKGGNRYGINLHRSISTDDF